MGTPVRGANATIEESAPLDARPLGRRRISMLLRTERKVNAPNEYDQQGICLRCQCLDFDVLEVMARRRSSTITARQLCYLDPQCVLCRFFSQWYHRDANHRQQGSASDDIGCCDVAIVSHDHGGLYPSYGQNCLRFALFDRALGSLGFFGRQVLLGGSAHTQTRAKLAGRSLQQDRVDYDVLKEWLACCETSHGEICQSASDALPLGLNVIDCPTRRVVPFPRTRFRNSFVTLSYVWGLDQHHRLPTGGKLLNSVPRVIEDAMEVTQRLGFRYLWVDRYCIPQDMREEKHSQIQNMGNIYAASALTIICAAGNDPQRGLTGVSAPRETEQLRVQIGDHTLIHQYTDPKDLILESKWNTRGWTYQEGVLARRRLVFTSEQAYFQCQLIHCLESLAFIPEYGNLKYKSEGNYSWVFPRPSSGNQPAGLLNHIGNYFGRSLTFDTDALDALRGIFELYRNINNPVPTLCGLPIFSASTFMEYHGVPGEPKLNTMRLVCALCWCSASPILRRPSFPSWTWAGWKHSPGQEGSRIEFDLLSICQKGERFTDPRSFVEFPVQIIAELADGRSLNWESEWNGLLELSQNNIHPRYLRIIGWTFPLTFIRERKQIQPCPDFPFFKRDWLGRLGHLVDEQASESSRRSLDARGKVEYKLTVLVLFHSRQVGTTGFLFLVPGNEPSTFERLTYCTVAPESVGWYSSERLRVPALLPPEGAQDWTPPFHIEYRELYIA